MNLVGGVVKDGIEGAIRGVGGVLDDLFTSDEERLTRNEAMERLRQQPQLAQIALNQVEATHRTVFVAGWRPFVGWVCGVSVAYHFMGHSLISWFFKVCEAFGMQAVQAPPQVEIYELIAILLAMLGVARYRTIEKQSGVAIVTGKQ